MANNKRSWIIRTGVALLVVAVVSFFTLMILSVTGGQGVAPIVPNPTGKGGAVFPITMVVLIPVVVAILAYGAINRLLRRRRDGKPGRRDHTVN